MQPCVSPVWDTAHAVFALGDAGMPPGVPLLIRSRICASFRVRKLGLFINPGARSPPFPSSPWHPAQRLLNCFCTAGKSEAGAAGVCAIPCAAISAAVINTLAIVFVIAYGSTFHFRHYDNYALLIQAKLG